MKAFRGTLLGLVLLAVIAAVVFALKPDSTEGPSGDAVRLFTFEKHELVHIKVEQPDSEPIVLLEEDGQWLIEDTDKVASRSMVNRAKHQIHDLEARANFDQEEELELYGLGALATDVTLTLLLSVMCLPGRCACAIAQGVCSCGQEEEEAPGEEGSAPMAIQARQEEGCRCKVPACPFLSNHCQTDKL